MNDDISSAKLLLRTFGSTFDIANFRWPPHQRMTSVPTLIPVVCCDCQRRLFGIELIQTGKILEQIYGGREWGRDKSAVNNKAAG